MKYQESLFDPELNRQMTGGMRKNDYILQNEALRQLEADIIDVCPIKLRYSCSVLNMAHIDGFTFCEFLGGILINSSSAEKNRIGIQRLAQSAKVTDIQDFIAQLGTVPDKYTDFSQPLPHPVAGAIILPGSNILKQLVNRWALMDIPAKFPNTYLKPHPVTDEPTLKELAECGPLLGREIGAAQLIQDPTVRIYTTMASTLAFQAKLLDKEVFSIREARPTYVAPFQHFEALVMSEWGITPEPWVLKAVLSNPLSGFFYPGYSTRDDLQRYFDYMLSL